NALFDAKYDSTVRVQVSRLRHRLDHFYQNEGGSLAERLVIPLGSYQVRLEARPAADPAKAPLDTAAKEPDSLARYRRYGIFLASVSVLSLAGCLFLGMELTRTRALLRQAAPQPVAQFWKTFFGNRVRTRIVLPTPLFFGFPPDGRHGSIMVRDTLVNEFADGAKSSPLQAFRAMYPKPPQLADNYTVNSDTFAAIGLERYLDQAGFETSVRSSADGLLQALDHENVIAIGTRGTLSALKPYLDRMDFGLVPADQAVANYHPRAGEPAQIAMVKESEQRGIWPGVIGVLPGSGANTHLLILTARHTAALVSFLTSRNGQDQLERIWKANGSPRYYEMVIAAEMNGTSLVRFWPMMLHPFRGAAQ
ncbi:MAG TPA: hypothetical protein VG672_21165, partial [Bryobacteraceae bacterium]|nr:hypothetical protein [Bryobacteraceae bacterium]